MMQFELNQKEIKSYKACISENLMRLDLIHIYMDRNL